MAGKHIKFDWAIKRLLRNKANFEVLEGFLSELLMFDVKIEEILDSESNQENEDDKFNRVDILVKDGDGNFMLIEVQNERQNDYFHRMLYGQAKLISERLDLGDSYGKLTKVYSVNIVYFPLGLGEDYVYVSDGNFYGLHKRDKLQLSRKQKKMYNADNVSDLFTRYYIIKVNQFDDEAADTLDEWIYFLKNSEIKEGFKAKGLAKAKEILRIDSLSPAEKSAYDIFVKNQHIYQSDMFTAYSDAKYEFEEKLEEAKQREAEAKQREKETKLKFAKKMWEYGEALESISKETGLSEKEIRELL